ncbi:hypothetical protein ACVIKO_004388 [Rhizobium ruizarguesonis]
MGNSAAHDDHVARVEMEQIGKADAQPAGFPANQPKCRFVTAARSLDNVSTRHLDVVGQGSQRRAVAWLCQSRRIPAERRARRHRLEAAHRPAMASFALEAAPRPAPKRHSPRAAALASFSGRTGRFNRS